MLTTQGFARIACDAAHIRARRAAAQILQNIRRKYKMLPKALTYLSTIPSIRSSDPDEEAVFG
jgi:hypothetical protein